MSDPEVHGGASAPPHVDRATRRSAPAAIDLYGVRGALLAALAITLTSTMFRESTWQSVIDSLNSALPTDTATWWLFYLGFGIVGVKLSAWGFKVTPRTSPTTPLSKLQSFIGGFAEGIILYGLWLQWMLSTTAKSFADSIENVEIAGIGYWDIDRGAAIAAVLGVLFIFLAGWSHCIQIRDGMAARGRQTARARASEPHDSADAAPARGAEYETDHPQEHGPW